VHGALRLLIGLLSVAGLLLAPGLASADTSSSLTIVGTSDLSDSGLVPNVIQPQFIKAFPQFTFKYTGTATGTAISNAENGVGGPSVLIVHAASLENQFVANGYSQEQYGRALFTNDFVLAGSNADPAGVGANAGHNIAQAFAGVAAAGANAKATFVSRGGTPGTTVQEHQIWALVSSSGLAPASLLLCTVNSTNGGGETPIAAGNGVTASGQPCPNGGALPTGAALPPWYVATGLTQGPNVQAANACNGYPSGANSCYVFTDRGTFDYLASGTDPAGSIPSLSIVTRDNSASAPGGANELINYFHAYIINPSKPNETVNLPAAQDFLNFLTSQSFQSQLKNYLPTSDPGGPPFKADASPTITINQLGFPSTYNAGQPLTLSGTLTNAEPGYPALAGQFVAVDQVVGLTALPVTVAKTDANGNFSVSFVPPATGSYEVTTGQIAQIENSTLSPPFGDLLSPAASSPSNVTVQSAITSLRIRSQGAVAEIVGSVAPGTGHVKGVVTVLAHKGAKGHFKTVASDQLGASDGNFALAVPLKAGKWHVKVQFADPNQLVGATSRTVKVTVGAKPSTRVSLGAATVSGTSLTASGQVKPAASAKGVKVELLALNTAGGTAASFGVKAKTTVHRGKTKFTLHAQLPAGSRWVLQLEAIVKGQPTSVSKLRTVSVKATT
jgi:ABC-type tungstate transport system permease subunit